MHGDLGTLDEMRVSIYVIEDHKIRDYRREIVSIREINKPFVYRRCEACLNDATLRLSVGLKSGHIFAKWMCRGCFKKLVGHVRGSVALAMLTQE